MLGLMRKHARNWVMKVLLFIIIIVFVGYFGSMSFMEKTDIIADVDGKSLTSTAFRKEYSRIMEYYQKQFGQKLNDEILKAMNPKQQVFDSLIYQMILSKKAEELNIRVTDEDVKSLILANPAFQRDGAFDDRIYREMIRSNRMTPEDFEEGQKKLLTTARLEELIVGSAKVSDQEVIDLFLAQNEKINISFISFSPKLYRAKVSPTTKDMEAYLNENAADFRVPEKIQVRYIAFLGQDYADSAKITDDDIAEEYARNKEKFKKKDGKIMPLDEARNIILDELKNIQGMYKAADAAKKAHDTIYQEEKMEAYAEKNKLQLLTTDFFPLNRAPLPFSGTNDFVKTLSALQKNEISGTLSDSRGYYLIKLVDKKASYPPSLKEVASEVESRYTMNEAQKLSKKDAEKSIGLLKEGGTLASIAGQMGLNVAQTGFFIPGGPIPNLGSSQDITNALFNLSEKKPYAEAPFYVDGNYVVVKFEGREKTGEADFAGKRESIKNSLLRIKRNELMQAWLENVKTSMQKAGKLKIIKEVKDL